MSSYGIRNYSSESLQYRPLEYRRANYLGRRFFGALGGPGPRLVGFRRGFGDLGGAGPLGGPCGGPGPIGGACGGPGPGPIGGP
jgi:hypothetical protein